MPAAVRFVANLLPLTHSLSAIRTSAIRGLGFEFVAVDLLHLLVFGTAMLALALASFRFAKD
jgi:hypothetical protein